MTKKDEQDDEVRLRSRTQSRKSFYKKPWFWIMIIFGVILGTIGIYLGGSEEGLVEEPIKQSPEEKDPE